MINVQNLEVMESRNCKRLEKTWHVRDKEDIWPHKNSEISSFLLLLLFHISLRPATLALMVLIRLFDLYILKCFEIVS